MSAEGMQLHDGAGRRKYLTDEERRAFLRSAEKAPRQVRTLCLVLAYTGCRITEALELLPRRIDLEAGTIIFESLKKRRKGVYRAVPVPPQVIDALDLVHGVREAREGRRSSTIRRMMLPTARQLSPSSRVIAVLSIC